MKVGTDSIAEFSWGRYRSFNWPALAYAPRKNSSANAKKFSPLRNAFLLPLEFQDDVAFGIPLLRLDACPSTVFWRVAKAAINSIYRASIRAFTHIGKKISKIEPLLADKNAFGSVVAILSVTGVRASPHHVDPRRVRWRKFAAQSVSVRKPVISSSAFDAAIDATTSTARTCSSFKGCAANRASASFFHAKIVAQDKFKGLVKT